MHKESRVKHSITKAAKIWDGMFINRENKLSRQGMKAPPQWPLLPELDQLYHQAIEDVQQALPGWVNPWIRPPDCYFVQEMDGYILYQSSRHEIWIYYGESFWFQQVDGYRQIIGNVLHAEKEQATELISGDQVHRKLVELSHIFRERHLHLESRGFPLFRIWPRLEREIFASLLRCQQQKNLDDLTSPYQALEDLYRILQERMHLLFIHELIHSWTKRTDYKVGKQTLHCLPGVQCYDYAAAHPDPHAPCYLHNLLDESITEWIAQQVYQGEIYPTWRDYTFVSGYPAWIIEATIHALNQQWKRVVAALPGFPSESIRNAEELIYTIYFRDPRAVTLLEEALTILCGASNVFTTISHACECFDLNSSRDETVLNKAHDDLLILLGPFLHEWEIHIPPLFGLQASEIYQKPEGS